MIYYNIVKKEFNIRYMVFILNEKNKYNIFIVLLWIVLFIMIKLGNLKYDLVNW